MNCYELALKIDPRVTFVHDRIYSAAEASEILHVLCDGAAQERFCVICVDGLNRVTATTILAQGGMHACAIQPKDVLSFALLARAAAIIIGHNHPSGDPSPSTDDLSLTRALQAAGDVIGISVLDHIIVATGPDGKKRSRSLMQDL